MRVPSLQWTELLSGPLICDVFCQHLADALNTFAMSAWGASVIAREILRLGAAHKLSCAALYLTVSRRPDRRRLVQIREGVYHARGEHEASVGCYCVEY